MSRIESEILQPTPSPVTAAGEQTCGIQVFRKTENDDWPNYIRNWLTSMDMQAADGNRYITDDDFDRGCKVARVRYRYDSHCYEFESYEAYLAFRLTWE